MTDAEYRLEKHTSNDEIKSDSTIDERYRNVEVLFCFSLNQNLLWYIKNFLLKYVEILTLLFKFILSKF
jgi:hypothetical protein